jgi:hypothetical protein
MDEIQTQYDAVAINYNNDIQGKILYEKLINPTLRHMLGDVQGKVCQHLFSLFLLRPQLLTLLYCAQKHKHKEEISKFQLMFFKQTLLDLACGDGVRTIIMKKMGTAKTVGVDVSSGILYIIYFW